MATDVRRRWYLLGLVLFLAGAGLSWIVVRDRVTRDSRERAQIEGDAVSLSQSIHFGAEPRDVDAAWAKRKPLYDDAMLAKLRDALNAFVEFEVAEFGDAKDVYLSGVRPETPSEAARAAHERLRTAFPSHADEIIKQFRDGVVEAAYRASPKVAHGFDPDLPRYDALYDDLVANFLPQARARIEELTKR
jgi:hypothetical protein